MSLPEIAAMYRRFARVEAARRSPGYAEITDRISRDARILALLAALPAAKRQPNLLLAAVQYLYGPLTGWAAFASVPSTKPTSSTSSEPDDPDQPTDLGRRFGDGPEVAGPAEALAMAITGRPVALANLDGEGVPLLRDRLAAA